MGKNIYVGNLPYTTTSDELVEMFTPHGAVASAQVIIDKFSGRSRGFGFVEMPNDEEAAAAVAALNGFKFNGRPLTVNEAKPREERGGGGGGGGAADAAAVPTAGADTVNGAADAAIGPTAATTTSPSSPN